MDPYKTLGVSREASEKEIKRTYRKLAKKYHPDVNDDPKTTKKFKKVTKAYKMITGNESIETDFNFHRKNFEDIQKEFWNIFDLGSKRRKKKKRIYKNIKIFLSDIINKRKIKLKIDNKKIKFTIPEKIRPGKNIKINHEPPIIIEFEVESEHFDIQGDDLIYQTKIDYIQALTGHKITIPNLKKGEKDYIIETPINCPRDHTIRLKNAGLRSKSGVKGDIVINIEVDKTYIPRKKLDEIRDFMKRGGYNEIS
ncbi:MAG: DnaJ domain-containing protein [archaeon]